MTVEVWEITTCNGKVHSYFVYAAGFESFQSFLNSVTTLWHFFILFLQRRVFSIIHFSLLKKEPCQK
jgi:hypothetical protein